MNEEVIQRAEELAEPILDSQGLELVEIQLRREHKGWVLRFLIDRIPETGARLESATPGSGVTLDDCVEVSQELSRILDVEELIPKAYVLEVSSPGLDRPLTKPSDFQRFRGRLVKVKTVNPEGRRTYKGRLLGLAEGQLKVEVDGNAVDIPHEQIQRVQLVPELDWGRSSSNS